MHEIVAGMVARLIRLSSNDPSSNPALLNYIFSPNRIHNSAIFTQMAWLGIFLSSTIVPNSYAATGIRTQVSTVVLHQTGTFRKLYQLSYKAAAVLSNYIAGWVLACLKI